MVQVGWQVVTPSTDPRISTWRLECQDPEDELAQLSDVLGWAVLSLRIGHPGQAGVAKERIHVLVEKHRSGVDAPMRVSLTVEIAESGC